MNEADFITYSGTDILLVGGRCIIYGTAKRALIILILALISTPIAFKEKFLILVTAVFFFGKTYELQSGIRYVSQTESSVVFPARSMVTG